MEKKVDIQPDHKFYQSSFELDLLILFAFKTRCIKNV